MPTPLQLPDAIIGAHLDSAFFVLCQGFLIWAAGRRADASRSRARRDACQTGLFIVAGVLLVELATYGLSPRTTGYMQLAVTRISLLGLVAALNWQLLRMRRLRDRAATKLRQSVRAKYAANRTRTRAEAMTRSKNEFLTSLAHELRTPLNAVIASADMVSRAALAEPQRAIMRRIIRETTHLGKVLNEALELRRVEDHGAALDAVPMDPVEIGRQLVDLFEARAQEKGLQLKFSAVVPAALSISGDPRRFRQALANLLDNAIKFSTRGSVELSLVFTPAPTSQSLALLTVHVKDTGVGLTVAHRTALLAGSANHPTAAGLPAAGMGLAIAQKIVRLFGGEITVRSRPGEGSEFGFTIPARVLNMHAPRAEEPIPSGSARRRVLIVDDVAANRLMLQMFLEQQGFSADYATGGHEAVELASRNRYDAVLMDLNMPDVDGLTATHRIRASERRESRAVIVAVTAAADADTRAKCFAVGMDGYFVKPLELRRFCADLTDLIAARQLVQSR